MAITFRLLRNDIKSSKNYGKYYAHTVKNGELTLEQIEQRVQDNCSAKASDVSMVIKELYATIKQAMQMGQVVNLGELGKLYISVKSIPVDSPEEFRVDRHIKGYKCNYTPTGKRIALDSRLADEFGRKNYVERSLLQGCKAVRDKYDPTRGKAQE